MFLPRRRRQNRAEAAPVVASLAFTSIAESTASVDLSSPARTDWAHFGDGGSNSITPVNRKSGGGSLISASLYGATPGVNSFSDSPRLMNWTDGSPTASSANNQFGVYGATNSGGSSSIGDGFSFVFQLGTGSNSIELYPGTYAGRVTVEAAVSDASSPSISNTTTIDDSGSTGTSGAVVIECTPGSAGQTLTVNVFLNTAYGAFANSTICGTAITHA